MFFINTFVLAYIRVHYIFNEFILTKQSEPEFIQKKVAKGDFLTKSNVKLLSNKKKKK